MKVTVDIECTPLEARQFFGLPDVQPMQATLLAHMEKKMMADMDSFTPEGLVKAWLTGSAQGADWFRGMFSALVTRPEGATDATRKG